MIQLEQARILIVCMYLKHYFQQTFINTDIPVIIFTKLFPSPSTQGNDYKNQTFPEKQRWVLTITETNDYKNQTFPEKQRWLLTITETT